MNAKGPLYGYSALLVGLAVALATAGYFLAGRIAAPPRPTSPLLQRVALIEAPRGTLELPVYTPLNTAQGLLARRQLGEEQGIWYSFPGPRDEGWSSLGLSRAVSVAFLDEKGRILVILDLPPCPNQPRCPVSFPNRVYRQVLEVPQGWFARHRIAPGQAARLKPLKKEDQPQGWRGQRIFGG
ncbi:DUF192 domain-containing protein [Meiothermus sp. QL-1]|uniref:DUF192 domain-containing protein n=1 Tax=Meiothermus sp. QL-1 TaxID=2058095 RepID=UPI000E0AD902|nr:DUF192 domain-containing protein [Meiothermus sp. QL-1]RDI96285.1 DUF192 domain-containing protein [Meiothermus sp. QL-1]